MAPPSTHSLCTNSRLVFAVISRNWALHSWNLHMCKVREFSHVQKNLTLSQLCAWCSICAILSPAAKITTCTCYDSMRLVHKAVNVHVKSCHPTVKLCRLGLFLNSEKLLSSVTLFRRVEILYAQQLDIFFVIYRYKVPSCAVQGQK